MTGNSSIRMILGKLVKSTVIVCLIPVFLLTFTGCAGSGDDLTSLEPDNRRSHYIPLEDIGNASQYWNNAWLEHSSELYNEIKTYTIAYLQTQQYEFGRNDCNDMAVDLWQKLHDKGIISVIGVGNLEETDETFQGCNHAWLIVYSATGSAAVIDLASGKIYTWEDVRKSPQLRQYWEGFIYEKPEDLRADFIERW